MRLKTAETLERELAQARAEIEFLEGVCESVLYSMVVAKAHTQGRAKLRQVARQARMMLKSLNDFCEYQDKKSLQ